jgi:hypothetical protein
MKKITLLSSAVSMMWSYQSQAQIHYVQPVFSADQIQVDANVKFGTNVNFLVSKFIDPVRIGSDMTVLKTAVFTGNPIPAAYYNPADTSTHIKVTDLKMDLYYPKSANDTTTRRPVFIYLHTGNFLPPCTNGSPTGSRADSAAVAMCMTMAQRGYVAITIDYRLGWNPLASTIQERRGSLLNGIFRVVHDVKTCVRVLKKDAAGANTYRINPNQIVIFGEGSGAYVTFSVATLNRFAELELNKFINPLTGKSYIDTVNVGNLEGFGGNLNLYIPNGYDAKISAAIGIGGAMADTSWIEAGDAPMMAFKCIRDPFAPFNQGLVTIPPPISQSVVDVPGPNKFIDRANRIGNNIGFKSDSFSDPYTMGARKLYGKTVPYIYPSPDDNITIADKLENCYPFLLPLVSDFSNQASPWQWWDPAGPTSTCIVAPPTTTAHQAALSSNPDMSKTKASAYIDTIAGYMCRRLSVLLGYYSATQLSVQNTSVSSSLKVYPNPAAAFTVIRSDKGNIQGIKLTDINGRPVYQASNLNTYEYVLEMPSLTKGIYFIEIETDQGFGVKKLLVD